MTAHSDRRPWRPWRSKVVWAVVVASLALGVLGTGTSGDKKASLRDALRRFNRRWFNPLVLRFAGQAPWPVARLEHRGRSSGALRITPVLSWPVAGGFVVPMPYGTEVDWARNLRHAGEGVLHYQGVRYRVGDPRVVPARDVVGGLPFPIGSLAEVSGVRNVMRVAVRASLTPEVTLPV